MKTENESGLVADLWRGCCVVFVVLACYWASVGPAYRLHCEQRLPSGLLAIYKPIVSLKSPLFRVTFRYVLLWM